MNNSGVRNGSPHAWKAREVHPRLQGDSRRSQLFGLAWRVFEQRRKAADIGSKLAADNAALIFLRELVEQAGHAYQLRGAPDVSRGGDAKRRRTAARHADALAALLSSGVAYEGLHRHRPDCARC